MHNIMWQRGYLAASFGWPLDKEENYDFQRGWNEYHRRKRVLAA